MRFYLFKHKTELWIVKDPTIVPKPRELILQTTNIELIRETASKQQKISKVVDKVTRRRNRLHTPEGRENQLIAKAMSLAERQIEDGSASSQVITHFLKQASIRDSLEREKIRLEHDLLRAKVSALGNADKREELFTDALNAFRGYAGQETDSDHDR
jgi:hypothetical protein